MKFLVISDVHANWPALQAVLAHAEGNYDQIVCCGDLVGYNARPQQIVEWTKANCVAVIRGNHDKAVAARENLEWFNEVARAAALWTAKQLNEDETNYLRGLPKGPLFMEHFALWHGSPRDEDEYITSPAAAAPGFSHLTLPIGFFGHTHVQGGFFLTAGKVGKIPSPRRNQEQRSFELQPDVVYMVNAGSVGQPRDGDPRAAYALFDTDQRFVDLRRVPYPIEETANEIKEAGLPDVLAFRLFQGL